MRSRSTWLIIGGALLALVVLAVFAASPPAEASHSSDSSDPEGTSLLASLAQAQGSTLLRDRAQMSPAPGLAFVLSPTRPYADSEADRLYNWVSDGGTLVYAAEAGDKLLDARFGLVRGSGQARYVSQFAAAPIFDGVHSITGGGTVNPFASHPVDAAVFLRGPSQEALGLIEPVGKGRLIALADPLVLCNGYLGRSDNGRLALDLLNQARGASVTFDEAHLGLPVGETAGASGPGWPATPWGAAILWAALMLFTGLALRGRAFGPRVPLNATGPRSMTEYLAAVGALLRRSGGRREALDLLLAATRRRLTRQVGIDRPGQAPDQVAGLLEQRSPDLARRYAEAERAVAAGARSERALLEAARRLHDLNGGGR